MSTKARSGSRTRSFLSLRRGPQRSDLFAFALSDTDAWHRDLLKEVRVADYGGRIRGEAGRELWMGDGSAVMGRRLPELRSHVVLSPIAR
jgi:hypothetical protein